MLRLASCLKLKVELVLEAIELLKIPSISAVRNSIISDTAALRTTAILNIHFN